MSESGSMFPEKFIGFVDIMGFGDLVERADRGEGMSLSEIQDAMGDLGSEADKRAIETYGPAICPESERISNELSFEITQVSDCVVVSTEVSPAGAITLLNHCWVAAFRLMKRGLMCRGYIRCGRIFHEGQCLIGPGYQEAVKREKDVSVFKRHEQDLGTPFIEVSYVLSLCFATRFLLH